MHIPLTDLYPELPEKEAGWGHWCCLCFCVCWVRACAGLCSQPCASVCAIWVFVCAHIGNTWSASLLTGPGGLELPQLLCYQAATKGNKRLSWVSLVWEVLNNNCNSALESSPCWLLLMGFTVGHWRKHTPGTALGQGVTFSGEKAPIAIVPLCSPVYVRMSIVSQNLSQMRPWRHFVHQSTTSKSFKCCKIPSALLCLEDHIWQSLNLAFQKNKLRPFTIQAKCSLLVQSLSGFWLMPEQVFC